ncbi:hypothetical protein AK812_SmicGene6116 [Symbiodinium microadriaticum]|uniref:Uncharacterized protein n=1 Tax=Symbiodinium microadriaticum TaxID=2951 RepID=A0A1Q9ES15_SYMMI|nr:hypothetical protein AK812_SmicGene6116 [Symbiodinium microadriaticum]
MGLATSPKLWKSMHDFLRRTHPTIHLAEINDDLVDFFNSVASPGEMACRHLVVGPVDEAVALKKKGDAHSGVVELGGVPIVPEDGKWVLVYCPLGWECSADAPWELCLDEVSAAVP